MKMILLGAPGAGKGTQAEILSKRLGLVIIGTGNIIREAIASGSELGRKFRSYTDRGALVPDDLVGRDGRRPSRKAGLQRPLHP